MVTKNFQINIETIGLFSVHKAFSISHYFHLITSARRFGGALWALQRDRSFSFNIFIDKTSV